MLQSAARAAGLDEEGWPPLRFHDLRHTFASHLIVDLELDVAQVSRILGHARITITLDTYTHLFGTHDTSATFGRGWRRAPSPGLVEGDVDEPGGRLLHLRQGPEALDPEVP